MNIQLMQKHALIHFQTAYTPYLTVCPFDFIPQYKWEFFYLHMLMLALNYHMQIPRSLWQFDQIIFEEVIALFDLEYFIKKLYVKINLHLKWEFQVSF